MLTRKEKHDALIAEAKAKHISVRELGIQKIRAGHEAGRAERKAHL